MTEIGLEDCIFAISTFGKKITLKLIQERTGIHRTILSRFVNQPRSSIKTEHLDKLLEFFYTALKECFSEIDSEIPSLLSQYQANNFVEHNTNKNGQLIFSTGVSFEEVYAEFGSLFPSENKTSEMRDKDFCFWVQTNLIQFFPNIEIDNYEGLHKVKIDRMHDVPTLWFNHTKDRTAVYDYSKPVELSNDHKEALASFLTKK